MILYDADLQKLNSLFIQNVKNSKWPPPTIAANATNGRQVTRVSERDRSRESEKEGTKSKQV